LVIDKTFRKPLYYELVIVGFYWNWLGITITKRRPAGRACGVGWGGTDQMEHLL
jgi:hypothetical protein